MTSPPIYLLPGMTVEYPVFSRLTPLLPAPIVLRYPDPERNESLRSFASRMSEGLSADSYVAGVSFGGIVALEISRAIQPRACFLISSIRGPQQLPPWLRAWRFMGDRNAQRVLRMVGRTSDVVPKGIRTGTSARIAKLAGSEGAWHRWATSAVLDWDPPPEPIGVPVIQIHGDADTTFPVRYVTPDIVIRHGRHALPMSHPREVAQAMRETMAALTGCTGEQPS